MDLPFAFCKRIYGKISEKIFTVSKKVAETSMKQENEEEEKQNNGSADLTVSGDGTWKKRGFSSHLEIHL